MTKWIAPIATVLASALAAFEPNIQALVVAHPQMAVIFGLIAALVNVFAPQPHKD